MLINLASMFQLATPAEAGPAPIYPAGIHPMAVVDPSATVGAGVHLGAQDLPVAVARRLLGPTAWVGGTARDPVTGSGC